MEFFDSDKTDEDFRVNLDLIEEKREMATLYQAAYKENVERYYNGRVKERAFKVGDLVLRKNESSHGEPRDKLRPSWEGPYKVVKAHRIGSYVLETL